jgi:MoaD family protein
MQVRIPSPLRSYTKSKSQVDITGQSLGEVIDKLDSQYPGIKFRIIDEQDGIRQHIKLFVNTDEVKTLKTELKETDVVHIICALSGG